ncbi:MAG: branched-chain amino acid ABC transporter permease [Caldilineaceae bacterium]
MSTTSRTTDTPEPKIGSDEWVAQIGGRQKRPTGLGGRIAALWQRIPTPIQYGLFLALALAFPLLTGSELVLDALGLGDNGFILRTAVRFFTFAILAMGLTVVVGYAGLLDLGYIAFMGIAGYLYAYLSSEFVQIPGLIPYGLAIPSMISIPAIVLLVAAIGYGIGAVSIRLAGDYLAIVTLGFGQVFLQLALTMTRVSMPGWARPVDFTRGPNGINNLDNISLFGYEFASTAQYYYLLLALVVLVYVVVMHLNSSRMGRAWRAVREDELAAEVMGMPTRRLKLLAFAIGAGIAALAGSVDAAFQGNVVPNPRYGALTLINLYAMVVLGGLGSLPGALIGALIFTALPELLRSVAIAGYLFYGALIIGLLTTIRPWRRLLWLLGGAIGGGYLFKLVINLLAPGLDAGYPPAGSLLNRAVQGWLVIPVNFATVGNVVTGAAVLILLGALLLRSRPLWHNGLLGLSIYAFAFAWETTLVANPAATRVLIVGLTLVILMIVRPQGLLGKTEVKIV